MRVNTSRTGGWLQNFAIFRSNVSGSAAVIFALSLVPALLVAGGVVDYARTTSYQMRLQSAADAAALATVNAYLTNGNSVTAATAAGKAVFQSQSGSLASCGSNADPVISVTPAGATTTSSVGYTGSTPSLFGVVTGSTCYRMQVSAQAQSAQVTTTNRTYSGMGDVMGDPHVDGADGSTTYMWCADAAWYNLLSDSGIQLNALCQHSMIGAGGIQASFLYGFEVLLGDHTIFMQEIPGFVQPWLATDPTNTNWWWDPNAPGNWFGQIVIDGVTYNPPMGQKTSYLGGAVVVDLQTSNFWLQQNNTVTVTTPTYSIVMAFEGAPGAVYITARNAGSCGVPGGVWGQTLGGIHDGGGLVNNTDFAVSSPGAKSAEFYRGTCALTTTSNSVVRLIH